jgi:hypothetical protein
MPPRSEKQRRAMRAAEAGNSTLGIPQSVGADFSSADPGGKLPETAAPSPKPKAPPAGPRGIRAMFAPKPARKGK